MRRLCASAIACAALVSALVECLAVAAAPGTEVVDRTFLCSSENVPGQAPFLVNANPPLVRGGARLPAGASVQTGQSALVAFTIGAQFDYLHGFCRPTRGDVPLSPRGLIGPERHGITSNCYLRGGFLVRARVLEAGGRVYSGSLAVRMRATSKPVFYATVSARSVTAYEALDCIPFASG